MKEKGIGIIISLITMVIGIVLLSSNISNSKFIGLMLLIIGVVLFISILLVSFLKKRSKEKGPKSTFQILNINWLLKNFGNK